MVGEKGPRHDSSPWSLSIKGLVGQERQWSISELTEMATDRLVTDIHCVTRWSKYDMEFRGIWLSTVLEWVQPDAKANFLSFVARSDRNHSTSLRLDEIAKLPAMLVVMANGEPLVTEHGGPLRMVVPGRYFYKSVKWLERIEVLAEDRLGYWEAETGYHNHADPWREERFLAPSLDKRTAAKLIASRDFSKRDLRSLDVSRRELVKLNARAALLRNANFCDAILDESDFSEANLSNAQFRRASLVAAQFVDSDLEGADFAGADLRGADLSGASFFGASFVGTEAGEPLEAIFDDSTRISAKSLEGLTDDQLRFVESRLSSTR